MNRLSDGHQELEALYSYHVKETVEDLIDAIDPDSHRSAAQMCSLGLPAGKRMPNGGVAAQVNTVFPRTLMSSSTSDNGSGRRENGSG
jgi:hypothetical protein